jgi:hypothetical protein
LSQKYLAVTNRKGNRKGNNKWKKSKKEEEITVE